MLHQYNVVVQPQHQQQQQQHLPLLQQNVTASLMGLPGSRQQQLTQQQQQHQQQPHPYQNIPAIVVNQPANVQCGDSATFQRLGKLIFI